MKTKRPPLIALLLLCFAFSSKATPELVVVGDPGNPGKVVKFGEIKRPYPRGGVGYPFRIGKREVSNAEYAEFLNACAAERQSEGLYDERMEIVRKLSGERWGYTAAAGKEESPVRFVSRVNAARYCNYLTTGRPDRGAYTLMRRPMPSGREQEVIVGARDTTFPDGPAVYYLPDMHEFFKAGWYDGAGDYRTIVPETRGEPSRYGMEGAATGVREWMENRYWGGAPFALGADDATASEDALNTAVFFPQQEDQGSGTTGFRVAATAPLQIGKRLNAKNNFFYDNRDAASLRLRYDGPARTMALMLEMRDFRNNLLWHRTEKLALRPGVTQMPIALPARDGYYELKAVPVDESWATRGVTIPLAVMRGKMPEVGAKGNFGMTVHISKEERGYNFEETDFDQLRRLGLSQIRTDVGYDDVNGRQTVLRRIHEAGLNPLGVITSKLVHDFRQTEDEMKKHPELVEKWAKQGVPAEYAWYAEQVFGLVAGLKGIVTDWEFGNEPTYWKVLPEDYAQIVKAGSIAARLANPEVNVISGDLNAIHAPVLQLGAGEFIDAVATHIYGFYVPMFWGIPGKMRELNGWMSAAGVGDRPIWITEIGGATYNSDHMIPVRELDEVRRYQALHQPKVMAGGMAFGAGKVLPYNFRDVPVDYYEEEFGMLDRDGLPKPAIAAYRTTARLLGDAKFAGFVEGHSMKAGEIAGLHFRDAHGEDIVVFWRNDPYGYGRFNTPFFNIISEPQVVPLPASGTSVELFDMAGGGSILPVQKGKVAVPVDEYPVFVRGRLSPAHAEVQTVHPVAKVRMPNARVKIRPNTRLRACDLMSGVKLELAENSRNGVEVSVYNIQGKRLEGALRLTPRSNWRERPWKVSPAEASLHVDPNGMATARFEVKTPAESDPARLFYLDATFTTDDGSEYRDTVGFSLVAHAMPEAVGPTAGIEGLASSGQWNSGAWKIYGEGFHFTGFSKDQSELHITRDETGRRYVTVAAARKAVIAGNASGWPAFLKIGYRSTKGPAVTSVSLLIADASGEIHQLKKTVKPAESALHAVAFNLEAFANQEGLIVYGGDGNGQIDYPARLFGFNFDFAGGDEAIELSVTSPVVITRDGEATPEADAAGGGAADIQ